MVTRLLMQPGNALKGYYWNSQDAGCSCSRVIDGVLTLRVCVQVSTRSGYACCLCVAVLCAWPRPLGAGDLDLHSALRRRSIMEPVFDFLRPPAHGIGVVDSLAQVTLSERLLGLSAQVTAFFSTVTAPVTQRSCHTGHALGLPLSHGLADRPHGALSEHVFEFLSWPMRRRRRMRVNS